MTKKMIQHVGIRGIASAIPPKLVENNANTDFPSTEIEKIIASTGVSSRRVVDENTCTSDLCFTAATKLLNELAVNPDEIDILIFISQTPDYVLPATACILQERLKLKKSIMAFDVNLGCSGYTYGLILVANLLSSGLYKKALLLAGDTISKVISQKDRSVSFLFGDAGSATLLEHDKNAEPLYFDFGTDGVGFDKLIIPAGACRMPFDELMLEKQLCEGNNYRAKTDLYMSGADVFTFTLREIPKTISACLQEAEMTKENVDLFFFHQANAFMLNHLIKKMGLTPAKVPMSLQEFGNTSVASIPLTLCKDSHLLTENQQLLLCGFGVGFSWATVLLKTNQMKVLPTIEAV